MLVLWMRSFVARYSLSNLKHSLWGALFVVQLMRKRVCEGLLNRFNSGLKGKSRKGSCPHPCRWIKHRLQKHWQPRPTLQSYLRLKMIWSDSWQACRQRCSSKPVLLFWMRCALWCLPLRSFSSGQEIESWCLGQAPSPSNWVQACLTWLWKLCLVLGKSQLTQK